MKRPHKNQTMPKSIFRYLPDGNPDQKWFKAHLDRQYRVRPRQLDEPDKDFVIIKQIYPGCRLLLGIGPEGAMLADTDEVLGKAYYRRGRIVGVIIPSDGTFVGDDELES